MVDQAADTADFYFTRANRCIEDTFGADYCKRNPEFRARLIAAYMAACVADFDTAMAQGQSQ